MNDEEKLMLFERKLLNVSRSCSLIELSRRKIVKNLDFYQEHEQHERKLKSLPVCLRDQVLRELTSLKFDGAFGVNKQNFERKLNDFSYLLSSETKEIELDGLMSFCPEEILHEQLTRVVQMIAAKAWNVQSLIINGRNSMTEIEHIHGTLDRATLEAICSLRKLKKLEISTFVDIEYSDLRQLCETLRFLEHVDVRIYDLRKLEFLNIDQFKRSFSRLKVFRFSLSQYGYATSLKRSFIEHMPKLRLMEQRIRYGFILPDAIDIQNLPSETSSLMNLAILYPSTPPTHQVFPELRHLTIACGWNSELNIDTLLHFSKLDSLVIYYTSPTKNVVYKLLDHYGLRLRKLVIKSFYIDLRLGEIFNRCKNLERLALYEATFSDLPLKPTQTFAELKELTWAIQSTENSNDGHHLLHLVSSPKLKKVSLTLDRMTCTVLDALKEISNLIANGQILRELESLIIYFKDFSDEEIRLPLFEAVFSLIANACAFLPKFTRVVLKPYLKEDFTPIYNSQGEFEGLSFIQDTKIDYYFRESGQPNLAKFLFASRAGRQF